MTTPRADHLRHAVLRLAERAGLPRQRVREGLGTVHDRPVRHAPLVHVGVPAVAVVPLPRGPGRRVAALDDVPGTARVWTMTPAGDDLQRTREGRRRPLGRWRRRLRRPPRRRRLPTHRVGGSAGTATASRSCRSARPRERRRRHRADRLRHPPRAARGSEERHVRVPAARFAAERRSGLRPRRRLLRGGAIGTVPVFPAGDGRSPWSRRRHHRRAVRRARPSDRPAARSTAFVEPAAGGEPRRVPLHLASDAWQEARLEGLRRRTIG